MSITQVETSPYNIYSNTAAGNSASGIKNSSTTIFFVTLDNTANGSPVYIKLYAQASGQITVGTSAPDAILFVGGSSEETFNFPNGLTLPALSAAVVTTGGTGGVTSPSFDVLLSIAYL